MFVSDGTVSLSGVQITNNSADKGGGFYLGSGTLTIELGTLQGNTATTRGAGGCYAPGTMPVLMNVAGNDPVVQDQN